MQAEATRIIRVQSEWNGWRTAGVKMSDLHEVHWFQPTGAPRSLVHGYVSCASITAGELPHNCTGTGSPHRLLVCVIKSHTSEAVYAELERRANAHALETGSAWSAISDGIRSLGGQTMMPLRTA